MLLLPQIVCIYTNLQTLSRLPGRKERSMDPAMEQFLDRNHLPLK